MNIGGGLWIKELKCKKRIWSTILLEKKKLWNRVESFSKIYVE